MSPEFLKPTRETEVAIMSVVGATGRTRRYVLQLHPTTGVARLVELPNEKQAVGFDSAEVPGSG